MIHILLRTDAPHPSLRNIVDFDRLDEETLEQAADRILVNYDDAVIVGAVPEAPQERWRVDYATGEITVVAAPEVVPAEVTMRQAKLMLLRTGKLADADAAIAALTGQAGDEARIEWEYAQTLRRDHPLVAGLGSGLGLDSAATDALFVGAAQIA